ncbi:MAG: amidohydrolase family protein [Solirubrobacterales bacterium]
MISSPIFDAWANVHPPSSVAAFSQSRVLRDVQAFFGMDDSSRQSRAVDDLLHAMGTAGVSAAVISGRVGEGAVLPVGGYELDEAIELVRGHPGRLRAAALVHGLDSIREVCAAIERTADDPMLVLVRVIPLILQEPINSRRFYPIYERCEALGLPISVNVGVPGPKVRAACQDPMLLDDVLIDFPELTVIAAHMGHPWERLLIRFMMKYERLYLMTSAYSPKYFDPHLVEFMNSSRGMDRVLFASDWPMLPLDRMVGEARSLPISASALRAYLGGNACAIFDWNPDPMEDENA